MPPRKVAGFKPATPRLARRTLTHYVATCHECEEIPSSPRQATVHATAEKHRVTETKHYVVEPRT